ncbi:MAG: hypothetical protein JJT89_16775 [Nitriliruptoraceae bacterium]|nr:hypothetical protein [Nitriliruptoraceae bacterium]
MEPTTIALIAVPVVLAVVLLVAGRRRRDQALVPVRLGPRWEHPDAGDASVPITDERVEVLVDRTGVSATGVATVLGAWDEFLAVLGFLDLPPGHRYRVYDPYDPPVVGRDAEGRPITDPVRVARDVAQRTAVAENDARTVLDALLGAPDEDAPDEDAPDEDAPGPEVRSEDTDTDVFGDQRS